MVKKRLLIGLLVLGFISISGVIFFQKQSKTFLSKPTVDDWNGLCSKRWIISADVEKFSYSTDRITKLVGLVTDSNVKSLEYDLVRYKGANDMINEFDIRDKEGNYAPAPDYHVGWQKINMSFNKIPAEFSLEPKFPEKFSKDYLVGIYFRATCKDGSVGHLTRIFIQKSGNYLLYAVGSSNPNAAKYFRY